LSSKFTMRFYFVFLILTIEQIIQRMDENYRDNYWETVKRNNFNLSSLLFHFLEKEKLHDED
jgi:hypothetical protein